jgi:hypothetical protein
MMHSFINKYLRHIIIIFAFAIIFITFIVDFNFENTKWSRYFSSFTFLISQYFIVFLIYNKTNFSFIKTKPFLILIVISTASNILFHLIHIFLLKSILMLIFVSISFYLIYSLVKFQKERNN